MTLAMTLHISSLQVFRDRNRLKTVAASYCMGYGGRSGAPRLRVCVPPMCSYAAAGRLAGGTPEVINTFD